MKKRLLCLFIAIIIVFSAVVVPVTSFAEEESELTYSQEIDAEYCATLGITQAQLVQLRKDIHNVLVAVEDSVNIYQYEIEYSADAFSDLCEIARSFNDIFYYTLSAYSSKIVQGTKYFTKLSFTYTYTKDECKSMYSECVEAKNTLINGLDTDELTDAEKALILHDRLALWCEYDYARYLDDEVPQISHTIYGALVNKIAVCQGYAYAYEWFLDELGIENHLCASNTLNHIWNVVTIDGDDYNVDVTDDDSVWDTVGFIRHTYFLKSYSSIYYNEEGYHYASDYGTYQKNANNIFYDSGFLWDDVEAAYQLLNGKIYFIDQETQTLCRYNGGNSKTVLADISCLWLAGKNSAWPYRAMLSSDGYNLYFNKNDGIYKFNISDNTYTLAFKPDEISEEDYNWIFGFKTENGYFYYEVNNTPNKEDAATVLKTQYAIRGDINGDGNINTIDRIIFSRYAAGWDGYDTINEYAADINKDYNISTVDRIMLSRYIAGWEGYTI